MTNPVSNTRQKHTHETPQVAPQPHRPQPKLQAKEVQDKVTLHKTARADHDGRSR